MILPETLYTATYPFTEDPDLRGVNVVVQGPFADRLADLNRAELLQWSLITGRPAYDFQNPYAFMANVLLTKPTLVPTYGIGEAQTGAQVAANIAANPGLEV